MTELEKLKATLEVHGSDVARWPEGCADELHEVMGDPRGRELVAEAVALERVLDAVDHDPVLDHEDSTLLVAKIMSATVDGNTASTDGTGYTRARNAWMVGGAMAAALLIGVFAGVNGIGAVVTQDGISFAQGIEIPLSPDDALLADLSVVSDFDLEGDV